MLRTALIALLALLLSATTASAEDAQPTALPAPPGSETEPNGTAGTATPIAAGERIRAVRTGGDVDHYRFTAEQGDRVFAAVVTVGDSRLAVLGPDGATVIESDDNGGTLGPQSSSIAGATIPATGTYYLKVDGPRHDSQLVPYDVVLDVQSGDPAPEAEPNDPQILHGERYVSGTRAAGDSDRFGLELEAGDTVFLSLDLDPERDGTRFNGRLAFGQEDLLDSDESGTGDANPSEAYAGTVDSAGLHLVSVDAAAADQSGTYVLSITVIPAVQRSCRTYTISPAAGEIPDRGTATFPIDVADAATIDHAALRLDVTHSFMRDLDATLEAPGNRIGLFDDIGGDRVGGPHTRMLTLFDDNAATQPVYEPLKGRGLQPEPAGSLGLLAGQQAAGTWNLFLRDDASSDVGTLERADLILCARPEEGPVETVFSAGFESGDDGFTHSGAGDEWERGTPATPASGRLAVLDHCAEGTGCFKTDLDGTYEPNSSQDLVSSPISLEGRSGRIYVSWEMWYQLESAHFDHLAVTVEEAGYARARPLFTWAGGDMWVSHGVPLVAHALSAGWGRHRADVSEYAGKTIQLRFHLDSDPDVQSRGVAIDDVRVYQPLAERPAPAPVAAAEPPVATAPPAMVAPAAAEPAISDLQLESRCVRRSSAGRVRVPMTMQLSRPGEVRVRVDRAVGSGNRRSCPRANPERNQRYRRVASFRPVAKVRAAAVPRQVMLDLRLRPGLYRLMVRVQQADGILSPPARRFLRVVG